MTNDEHKAISDALCKECGGLIKLPDAPTPATLLRWCICNLQAIVEEPAKEPLGFAVKAEKRNV